jgi:hypothetical protein
MTCKSLHKIIEDNDLKLFEEYLKSSKNPLDFQYENMIISNHKKDMLLLLINYNCISEDGMSLSGMFDSDSKLLKKLKEL